LTGLLVASALISLIAASALIGFAIGRDWERQRWVRQREATRRPKVLDLG